MRYRAEGGTLIGVKVTIIIKLAELFDVDHGDEARAQIERYAART
jgi:hypothetical protein